MSIPYRARQALRRFFTTVLALTLLALLVLFLWLLWLNRYVIYSKDGAKLDFSLSVQYAPGVTPQPPEPSPTITIYDKQQEQEDQAAVSTELSQFSGYYVTLDALHEDFDAVSDQLAALADGSTVMLELKDVRSRVYYTSQYAQSASDFDVGQMDDLIAGLLSRNLYVIAQIPAFQEYHYILENEKERVPSGLARRGGNGSLWLDSNGPCYWLNPTHDDTLTYLIKLVTELRGMGFDEVVFSDFRFPDTDQILFDGDRMEALCETAAILVKTCSTERFCVSFTRSSADLALPEGRTRLYLTGVPAAQAGSAAADSGLENPAAQIVFLTELSDTRYEAFCVLRPLGSAH